MGFAQFCFQYYTAFSWSSASTTTPWLESKAVFSSSIRFLSWMLIPSSIARLGVIVPREISLPKKSNQHNEEKGSCSTGHSCDETFAISWSFDLLPDDKWKPRADDISKIIHSTNNDSPLLVIARTNFISPARIRSAGLLYEKINSIEARSPTLKIAG